MENWTESYFIRQISKRTGENLTEQGILKTIATRQLKYLGYFGNILKTVSEGKIYKTKQENMILVNWL